MPPARGAAIGTVCHALACRSRVFTGPAPVYALPRSMRILHVIRSLDPRHGGPSSVAARLAAAQAALGHPVSILCERDDSAQERLTASLAPIPGIAAVRLVQLVPPQGPVARLKALHVRRWCAENLGAWDHLHLHGVWDAPLVAAAAAARKRRVPYAVAPHGMLDPWSLWGQSFLKRLKKKIALALVYRRMLEGAAFLHALNADEASLIEPLGLRVPSRVLPNGIFEQELSPLPPADEFARSRPPLAGSRYVLFLSRLHFKKGLDILVPAFEQVSREMGDVHLVIAGPDDGAQAAAEDLARQLRIEGRVHFVGPLYSHDKLAALAGCACFCLPSRQEGFSIAVTEALACGRPVVISQACHFPEVGEAAAGVITRLDPGSVAAALRRILTLPPADALAMGGCGRELVLSRFTWPKVAARSIELYSSPAP